MHPEEDCRLVTVVFEDKFNREMYLVDPGLWHELPGEIRPVCLFLTVNRQADPFLAREASWTPTARRIPGMSRLWPQQVWQRSHGFAWPRTWHRPV